MACLASTSDTPACMARRLADAPYNLANTDCLASVLCLGVNPAPKRLSATDEWMSRPLLNASIIPVSPARWAITRTSMAM